MQKSGKVKSQAGTEAPGGYELDAQVGFLLRVAMQRHTSIFMSHMVDELTQTQFAVMANAAKQSEESVVTIQPSPFGLLRCFAPPDDATGPATRSALTCGSPSRQ